MWHFILHKLKKHYLLKSANYGKHICASTLCKLLLQLTLQCLPASEVALSALHVLRNSPEGRSQQSWCAVLTSSLYWLLEKQAFIKQEAFWNKPWWPQNRTGRTECAQLWGLVTSSLKSCAYLLHFLGCIEHGSDNHHSIKQVQWYSMRRHDILCASRGETKQKKN